MTTIAVDIVTHSQISGDSRVVDSYGVNYENSSKVIKLDYEKAKKGNAHDDYYDLEKNNKFLPYSINKRKPVYLGLSGDFSTALRFITWFDRLLISNTTIDEENRVSFEEEFEILLVCPVVQNHHLIEKYAGRNNNSKRTYPV